MAVTLFSREEERLETETERKMEELTLGEGRKRLELCLELRDVGPH